MQKTNKLSIFAPHWFAPPHTREAIKRESGVNPEQSRCCKFYIYVVNKQLLATGKQNPGRLFATGTSQKTCHVNSFHCFRGKSVESNDPDSSSIISFITLIQRKCVQTNKLCQVYLVCPAEGISPGHFYGKIVLFKIINNKTLMNQFIFSHHISLNLHYNLNLSIPPNSPPMTKAGVVRTYPYPIAFRKLSPIKQIYKSIISF